ncbi:MAG: hypothetical protein IJL66_03690 [Lachnospiraceae bacterium]|nr:hypothetical protein [Lachnospiraceae bacterium]
MSKSTKRVAFCGLLTALGVVLLTTGGLMFGLTYAAPLLAGALLIPVREEHGTPAALMTWAATAILGLILCGDKEAAFFYLFLGHYPVVKPAIDRLKPRALRIAAKTGLFACLTLAMYGILFLVFPAAAGGEEFFGAGTLLIVGFFIAMVLLLLLCDLVYGRAEGVYRKKLRPLLKNLL